MSQEKSHEHQKSKSGPIEFLFENSAFLIIGTVAALIWANLSPDTYQRFANYDLMQVVSFLGIDSGSGDDDGFPPSHDTFPEPAAGDHGAGAPSEEEAAAHGDAAHGDAAHDSDGHGHGGGHGGEHGLTLHFVVNDILMALFFAIAGKEVWEAMLPGGALSNPRKAATPLLATAGGVIGPAGLYLGALYLCHSAGLAEWEKLSSGWAVPCATDIAFSYLVARIIFGGGHPAIAFLLLLAIADDAAGLVILAIAYPQKPLVLAWLLLAVAAIGVAVFFRVVLRLHSFWWYLLIPGVMSWFSFQLTGIHAALGLIPIIPCLPHAHSDLGLFAKREWDRHDTLNEFEHWWERPVELILGLFGLVNAGVGFSSVGVGTWLVLFGLVIGKPLGITFFTWVGDKLLKLEIPEGMSYRHVISLGTVAGIGFTVALFVSTAAFQIPPSTQETLDAVKMGALGSFFAGVIAYVVARCLGVRPEHDVPPPGMPEPRDDGEIHLISPSESAVMKQAAERLSDNGADDRKEDDDAADRDATRADGDSPSHDDRSSN